MAEYIHLNNSTLPDGWSHLSQSGLLPLLLPAVALLSANAGCSIIASNNLVPRSAFVNGKCPFGASNAYLNSCGHFLYTLFSPCTQSIALKNLFHCLRFWIHISRWILYPNFPPLAALHRASIVRISSLGIFFISDQYTQLRWRAPGPAACMRRARVSSSASRQLPSTSKSRRCV